MINRARLSSQLYKDTRLRNLFTLGEPQTNLALGIVSPEDYHLICLTCPSLETGGAITPSQIGLVKRLIGAHQSIGEPGLSFKELYKKHLQELLDLRKQDIPALMLSNYSSFNEALRDGNEFYNLTEIPVLYCGNRGEPTQLIGGGVLFLVARP